MGRGKPQAASVPYALEERKGSSFRPLLPPTQKGKKKTPCPRRNNRRMALRLHRLQIQARPLKGRSRCTRSPSSNKSLSTPLSNTTSLLSLERGRFCNEILGQGSPPCPGFAISLVNRIRGRIRGTNAYGNSGGTFLQD